MRREDRDRPLLERLIRDGVLGADTRCQDSIQVPAESAPWSHESRSPYMPMRSVRCGLELGHDGVHENRAEGLTWKRKP